MLTVPDRLLKLPSVKVYYHSLDASLLHKQLEETSYGRQSYISKHVFSMVVAGEQHINQENGHQLIIKAGEMACIKKGLYTINDLIPSGQDFEVYLLFFTDDLLNQLFANYNSSIKDPIIPKDYFKLATPNYLKLFWQSIEQLALLPELNTEIFPLKVEEFFSVLQAIYPKVIEHLLSIRAPQVKGLKSFMEANFDKGLTIEDYAYLTGRSSSTFRREFKTKFGTTPRRWIIQKRMEKAKSLLQKKQLEVSQVALEVGYENVSHFISAFKKTYGHTPKQSDIKRYTVDATQ